ncbi:hypothetical protein PYW08_010703 [Mythimna loreyi]|uniref:Uncharacterized protein n=1 Tax=Mythimna loreyi TaxID=667449 RepID=A0ACC2Q3Z6_9NEOP|nr:hypothetical protein PYW08_010703 [Mythimna loreyi]
MTKVVLVLSVLAVFLIAESTCQRIILPTYRPPPAPRRPVIMRARREADDQPLWLWQGDNIERAPSTADHPSLPSIIDDIKLDPNRRTARSLSTPRASRGGRALDVVSLPQPQRFIISFSSDPHRRPSRYGVGRAVGWPIVALTR